MNTKNVPRKILRVTFLDRLQSKKGARYHHWRQRSSLKKEVEKKTVFFVFFIQKRLSDRFETRSSLKKHFSTHLPMHPPMRRSPRATATHPATHLLQCHVVGPRHESEKESYEPIVLQIKNGNQNRNHYRKHDAVAYPVIRIEFLKQLTGNLTTVQRENGN